MTAPHALAEVAETSIPMKRLIKVELRKLVNTRAGMWLVSSIGVIGFALMVVLATTAGVEHLTFVNFFGMLSLPTSFLLPVLAILLVTSEWSQRTGLVTFTIEPKRTRVVVAKLTTSLMLVVASIILALVLSVMGTFLAAAVREGVVNEWQMSWEVLRNAFFLQLLYLLEAFGFAMLIMSSAAAIVAYFALPTVWTVLGSAVPWLHDHVQDWLDFTAASSVFQNGEAPFQSAHPVTATEWSHLAVSGFIWVVLPVTIGAWRLVRAEMK